MMQLAMDRVVQIELLQLRFDLRPQPLVSVSGPHEVDLLRIHLACLEAGHQPIEHSPLHDFLRPFGRGFHFQADGPVEREEHCLRTRAKTTSDFGANSPWAHLDTLKPAQGN